MKSKTRFLDNAHALLMHQEEHIAMDMVFKGLSALHAKSKPEEWRRFVASEVLAHPIKELIHLCPFTRRSFLKPLGYAGDAGLIDFIYGTGTANQFPLDDLASAISHYTLNVPVARAVRYRRELLARCIDEVAAKDKNSLMLSIASGHLREIELSQAARKGEIGCFYALDQDQDSIALIQRKYAAYNVSASVGSVHQLLSNVITFEGLSLVYAAGLFDYLEERVAQRLVEKMFGFLKPGGRMLIANFLPNLPDVGYMESYMDWFLIFRSPEEMLALFNTLPEDQISSLMVSFDPDKNIVFAEAVKV
ncbi:methyltransferase [Methylosoma difficile]